MTKITHLVVHYSATYADQNLTVKDIDKMHRERGWQMVGYHYVIRRDGVIERGRPETMVGAHVANHHPPYNLLQHLATVVGTASKMRLQKKSG